MLVSLPNNLSVDNFVKLDADQVRLLNKELRYLAETSNDYMGLIVQFERLGKRSHYWNGVSAAAFGNPSKTESPVVYITLSKAMITASQLNHQRRNNSDGIWVPAFWVHPEYRQTRL